MTILNDGDRVVYDFAGEKEFYIKIGGIWYLETNKRDVVIKEDINNGFAEKL